MRAHWNRINDWLDHRTGVHTAVRKFLYEDIPASSGWHQVFGSVALFLFLVQSFSGALLAFNYAPTPGDAYNSLRYILTELTGGRLMRGLHHWGASLMIMPYLSRLLGGQGSIGVVTFARFFGLHVLLLPPATAFLIAVHVYLVRKHGVAPAPGDELVPKKKFYPEQVFKDTMAIFAAFAILFVMAVAARVPLEQLADPTDTSYVPRPEWYFLFLFQLLKLFTGPLEVVGRGYAPHFRLWFCRAGRHRLDRIDCRSRDYDTQGGQSSRCRLLRPDRLDGALVRGTGRRGLFPPRKLRELPCGWRHGIENRS